MFLVCWEINGQKAWELLSGEDGMQQFVAELVEALELDPDEILVGELYH